MAPLRLLSHLLSIWQIPAKTSTEQFVKLTNHYGVQNGIFGALEQSHSDSPIGSSFWQKYSLLQYTMTLLQGPKDPVFPTLLIILMPAAVSQFFLIWSTQIASTGNVNDVKLLYFGGRYCRIVLPFECFHCLNSFFLNKDKNISKYRLWDWDLILVWFDQQ